MPSICESWYFSFQRNLQRDLSGVSEAFGTILCWEKWFHVAFRAWGVSFRPILCTSFPIIYTDMLGHYSIDWVMAWAKICLNRLSVYYLVQLDCVSAISWHVEENHLDSECQASDTSINVYINGWLWEWNPLPAATERQAKGDCTSNCPLLLVPIRPSPLIIWVGGKF